MTDEQNNGNEKPADEAARPEGEPTEPSIEDLQKEVERLTGEARKWETRSKSNHEKAKELDALKAATMTAEEKAAADVASATERAEKAEAALARYQVAVEFNLSKEDTEALEAVKDPEALRALAERLKTRQSGPQPNPSQGKGGKPAPTTPQQAFADALDDLF